MLHPIRKALFPLWGLLIIGQRSVAQEENPGVAWGSAYIATGAFADHRAHLFPGDIQRLTQGSGLLARDMSDHTFKQAAPTTGAVFQMAAGYHPFRNVSRPGPELRLGMLFASQQGINAVYERSSRVSFDTLTSAQTGAQYVVDSVVRSSYEVAYRYSMAGVHGAMLWRTGRRFSFYGGIGAAIGVVYGVDASVQHRTMASIQSVGITGPVREREESAAPDQEEKFAHGVGHWWQWHVPLGMDYRLHRDHELWGRMHLYYEIVPQVLFVQRPALRYTSGIGVQSLFGLRLKL